MACSKYINVDENIPPSNITYYVEGNAKVATKLILNLSVYNGKQGGFAIVHYLEVVTCLYKKSLDFEIPQQIESAIIKGYNYELKVSNRKVAIEKKKLENKKGGYLIKLKIVVDPSY